MYKIIWPRRGSPLRKRLRMKLRTNSHKDTLIRSFGSICYTHNGDGCGQNFHHADLTIDHVLPKSMGGDGDIVNKQLLCLSCHYRRTIWYNQLFGLDKRPTY